MPYLLDTNALSEADKPRPDQGFMKWFEQADVSNLYTSCLNVGELYKGIALQTNADKQQQLTKRTELIVATFDNRVLSIEQVTVKIWAQLLGAALQKGRPSPAIDALIAAQCLQHQLTIVTRNLKDFQQFPGLHILCPWAA